jgi:hypothetical protein
MAVDRLGPVLALAEGEKDCWRWDAFFTPSGSAHQTFARNGFWHGAAGARNRHVSAVALLPDTELWKLRNENRQPILAVNPWARHRLPDALRTLPRFEPDNDLWVFRDGERAIADIGRPLSRKPRVANGPIAAIDWQFCDDAPTQFL